MTCTLRLSSCLAAASAVAVLGLLPLPLATATTREAPPQARPLPKAPPPSGITLPDGRPLPAGPPVPQPPTAAAARPAAPAEPLAPTTGVLRRANGSAFGEPVRIDVRAAEVATADSALHAAFEEIQQIEALTDPAGDPRGDGLAALDAAAGGAPQQVDPRLLELLGRADSFCRWSRGAHGPLGGRLYTAWGLRGEGAGRGRPSDPVLRDAVAAASCDRLRLDRDEGYAQLAEGAVADLGGFAAGFAVDRAVSVLRQRGVVAAFVEIGWVRRAFGDAPGAGSAVPADLGSAGGWPVALPVFPGLPRPLERVRLQDQALAVASAIHRPLLLAGDRYAPWIDQRSGRPAEGVEGVVAVSELAVDAQALAASLFVLGNREGMARAGVLEPHPSALWLLGDGQGPPVLTYFNWSRVATE